MRLGSWFSVLTLAVLAAAVGGACGSTSSNKGGGSNDGSDSGSGNSNTSSSSSGGDSSSSSSSGGDSNASSSSGGDSGTSSSSGGSGGNGGSGGSGGGSDEPATAECGGMTCEGLSFGIGGIEDADACCPEGEDEAVCGLDTSPLENFDFTIPTECQPRNSPGELDESCPVSPPLNVSGIMFDFPGCCLPSGKCGFMLDTVAQLVRLDLGCVDATMFFEDLEEPPDCTPMQGEGGAAN